MDDLWLRRLLNKVPGRRQLGVYRFLPVFFLVGAAMEFTMINMRIGQVNFYDTYKRKQAKAIVEGQ